MVFVCHAGIPEVPDCRPPVSALPDGAQVSLAAHAVITAPAGRAGDYDAGKEEAALEGLGVRGGAGVSCARLGARGLGLLLGVCGGPPSAPSPSIDRPQKQFASGLDSEMGWRRRRGPH